MKDSGFSSAVGRVTKVERDEKNTVAGAAKTTHRRMVERIGERHGALAAAFYDKAEWVSVESERFRRATDAFLQRPIKRHQRRLRACADRLVENWPTEQFADFAQVRPDLIAGAAEFFDIELETKTSRDRSPDSSNRAAARRARSANDPSMGGN